MTTTVLCPPNWTQHQSFRQTRLTRHLEHRLTNFALGWGARDVSFKCTPDGVPVLVATTRDGKFVSLKLPGPAGEWHAALDQVELTYDEPVDEGLHRFLGLAAAA